MCIFMTVHVIGKRRALVCCGSPSCLQAVVHVITESATMNAFPQLAALIYPGRNDEDSSEALSLLHSAAGAEIVPLLPMLDQRIISRLVEVATCPLDACLEQQRLARETLIHLFKAYSAQVTFELVSGRTDDDSLEKIQVVFRQAALYLLDRFANYLRIDTVESDKFEFWAFLSKLLFNIPLDLVHYIQLTPELYFVVNIERNLRTALSRLLLHRLCKFCYTIA